MFVNFADNVQSKVPRLGFAVESKLIFRLAVRYFVDFEPLDRGFQQAWIDFFHIGNICRKKMTFHGPNYDVEHERSRRNANLTYYVLRNDGTTTSQIFAKLSIQ